MYKERWQPVMALVLGLYVVVSPWLLGFSPERVFTWNAVIAGLMLVAISLGPLAGSARSA